MNQKSQVTDQLTKTLNLSSKETEKTWGKLADLTSLLNSPRDSLISLNRLISFNPTAKLENNPNITIEYYDPEKIELINQSKEVITQQILKISNQIEKDPKNASLWIILGHCYALLNDFENAYTAYTNVLNLDPSSKDQYFLYGIGSVKLHYKYLVDSCSHFQNIISLNNMPESPDIHFRYAIMLRMMGENLRALKALEDIKSKKTFPPNLTIDDIDFQIAFTCQLDNQFAKARSIYSMLYQRHPDTIEIVQQYCWFLSLLNDQQSLNEAEQLIHNSNLNDPFLNFVQAQIAMKKDDMNTAYNSYCGCISFWNDSPLFWCGLGVLYFRNEQDQDAIVAFQRALYLKGELVEAWANLGLIFELINDQESALKIYDAAETKCENNQIIVARKKALQMGKKASRSMILEVSDSRYFQQIPEKIANQYLADSPLIPAEQIGVTSSIDRLIPCHLSLF